MSINKSICPTTKSTFITALGFIFSNEIVTILYDQTDHNFIFAIILSMTSNLFAGGVSKYFIWSSEYFSEQLSVLPTSLHLQSCKKKIFKMFSSEIQYLRLNYFITLLICWKHPSHLECNDQQNEDYLPSTYYW